MSIYSQLGKQYKMTIFASKLLELNIQFPGIQREIMLEHIQEIVDFQKAYFEQKGHYLFLGLLEICHFGNKYYCIDGQHRYHAIEVLKKQNTWYDWQVDMEIIECQSEQEMIDYFKIINKNKPVPDFLTHVESKADLDIICGLREFVRVQFGPYISKSERPQRPNINLDSFLNELDKKYKLTAHFSTAEEAIAWLELENQEHRTTLMEKYKGIDTVQKALEKVELGTKTRHGKKFYLGCYWLDSPVNKLSQAIRKKLWSKWYSEQPANAKSPSGEILCPCCEETFISALQFEAGHKRSFKNGGTDELVNLVPICSGCNRSMGIMDYDDYKKSLV